MVEKFDWIHRSEFEDIWVSLLQVRGAPHVQLRVYHRSARLGGDSLPGSEGITMPVAVLPDLIRVLEETQERLAQEGPPHAPLPTEATTSGPDEPVTPPRRLRGDRRGHRIPVKVPVECRHVGAVEARGVTGETRDVSAGGAQIWLRERFPLLSRVEVFMHIGTLKFQGRAEVVGVGLRPKHGRCRHSIRWLDLNAHAKAILSKLTTRR